MEHFTRAGSNLPVRVTFTRFNVQGLTFAERDLVENVAQRAVRQLVPAEKI